MAPVQPDFKEFLKLSRKGNLIPVHGEILADLETPVSSFLKIDRGEHAFLLESVEGGQSQARYSFLGSEPSVVIEGAQGKIRLTEKGKTRVFADGGDPLKHLEKLLSKYRFVESSRLPRFSGGAVGFMSYDCNRFYEKMPASRKARQEPDLFFMITDTLLVFDHVQRKILVVSNAFVPPGSSAPAKKRIYETAVQKIAALSQRLRTLPAGGAPAQAAPRKKSAVESNFTKDRFEKSVRKAKEYIKKGDAIQIVLSQRFSKEYRARPFDIYRALRSINPSPYMFYLKCGAFTLVGSSPEVHVRCEEGRVMLRPIAGTRPRGRNEKEDAALAKGLLADPKERAEHVMLVDLGRNDLGRVCEIGSVKVDELMTIERYSHVMHIVSQVSGRLLKGKSVYDVIRATFPAGTVSGAPKVRAMEIISELEPEPRGPYAGLVGYLSFSGNFDSCITIRTVLLKNNRASVQAGAGIVADSKPDREWMETHNKARGVLKAVEAAEGGLS